MRKRNLLLCAAVALLAIGCCKKESNLTLSGLDKKAFQAEINGKQTDLYVLKNNNGTEVAITNYGGRIVSIWVPDAQGKFADVVCGYSSVETYQKDKDFVGALIGRYGNRIGNARFVLDGTSYELPKNDGVNSLHGGATGFHHVIWDAKQLSDNSVEMSYLSPDGEAGYPGNVTVKVIYTLDDKNALTIAYEAETDKPTVLNLTNHAYFNLSGDPVSEITDHELLLNADGYTPVDQTLIPTGEVLSVEGTPMDFRVLTPIGLAIDADDQQIKNGKGFDHNWALNTNGDATRLAAKVIDPKSGRSMEVYTTEPGIQFYSGNFMGAFPAGKTGEVYPYRSALCLETQHYPDAPNKEQFSTTVVRPGEKYTSLCIYKFGIE